MGPVGGSGGWLGEKNSKNFFVPNELKSPKNNMFFLHTRGGGWVCQKQVCIFTHFFYPFPNCKITFSLKYSKFRMGHSPAYVAA